jgi:paraquat-inducible protein B
MSRHASPTAIGAFVLGALVLVLVAIVVFSSGALIRERVQVVTFFPGTVQGLNLGAQVQFQGVPIGQVTAIDLDYLSANDSFRIPVRYEIWPQRVHIVGEPEDDDPRDVLRRMVSEKGLRARLESVSFVTGQYVIVLGLYPDAPPAADLPQEGSLVRVPAVAATRDRVEEMLANLEIDPLLESVTGTLQALRELLEAKDTANSLTNLDQTLAETRTLMTSLKERLPPLIGRADQTLLAYGDLAVKLQERVDTLADGLEQTSSEIGLLARRTDSKIAMLSDTAASTVQDAGQAMRAITGLAGPGSSTRVELDRLLGEATRAARSLRMLADYLERHPEALIQGKR